jgi:hypothetical protein
MRNEGGQGDVTMLLQNQSRLMHFVFPVRLGEHDRTAMRAPPPLPPTSGRHVCARLETCARQPSCSGLTPGHTEPRTYT